MQGTLPFRVIHEGLRPIVLPPLTRPSLGPSDKPTQELVLWSAQLYAYSSVAHMRTVLAGLVALADIGNEPTAYPVCRHIFEWAAHSCYMVQQIRSHFAEADWKAAFELFLKTDTGNLWLKRHGRKYGAAPFANEVAKPLDIMLLVSTYEAYQLARGEEGDAKDAYGFLSEHSHPNGACFLSYRKLSGWRVKFVPSSNDTRVFYGVNSYVLDWLMFIEQMLELSQERLVRSELQRTIKAVVAQCA
jgi:hypothetical protein